MAATDPPSMSAPLGDATSISGDSRKRKDRADSSILRPAAVRTNESRDGPPAVLSPDEGISPPDARSASASKSDPDERDAGANKRSKCTPATHVIVSKDGGGLRFNEGKLRHDLVPTYAYEQFVRVLTRGAQKYAPRNWERGMKWTTVLASLERHVHAFKRGEDYDEESGLPHMAHVMCNAAFLAEYARIYPEGDDRPHHYRTRPKISLDIDEVLADFLGHWQRTVREKEAPGSGLPSCWHFDADLPDKLVALKDDEEFWMSIPPKIDPDDELPVEPHCYITSRVISPEITRRWLLWNRFPDRPIYVVPPGSSKAAVFASTGADWHVDDNYDTFVEMTRAGICCWLMDAPHNRRYEVGFKRIRNLKELAY